MKCNMLKQNYEQNFIFFGGEFVFRFVEKNQRNVQKDILNVKDPVGYIAG